MDTNKIIECINQMRPEHRSCLYEHMNYTIQEIMDFEAFGDEGPKNTQLHQLLTEIGSRLNNEIAAELRDCVLEFCITNDYMIEGEPWNCINHLLGEHDDLLTPKDKKYLKTLNASYMSFYKVSSIQPGVSFVLKDMIEKSEPVKVLIPMNPMSDFLRRGSIIAARLLSAKSRTKSTEYTLSNSLLIVPEQIAKSTANNIKGMTKAMERMMSLSFLPQEMMIEDTPHNNLLTKKMWTKDILEAWYLYKDNYLHYHELYDYDYNPWQPCRLEFKIATEPKKLKDIFNEMAYWTKGDKPNTWDWLDEKGCKNPSDLANSNEVKTKDPKKSPLLAGSIIANFTTGQFHKVIGEVALKKDKLIIDVSSTQRAHIVQDFIETTLGQMVGKPVITKKDVNDPSVHYMGMLK